MTAFRAWWGLIWNRKSAVRFRKGGRQGVVPDDTSCPLCGQPDSTGHILGGCSRTDMQGCYIKRHDQAVKLVCKAIAKGQYSGCFTIMDAGRAEELPTCVACRRVNA
jgi:hypothetical protein